MKTNNFLILGALALLGFIVLSKAGGPSVEVMRENLASKYSNEPEFLTSLNIMTPQEVSDVYLLMIVYNGNGSTLSPEIKSRLTAIGTKYNIFT